MDETGDRHRELQRMVDEGLITYKEAFDVLKRSVSSTQIQKSDTAKDTSELTTPNSEIVAMLYTIEGEIYANCGEEDDKRDDWCVYGCSQKIDVYDLIIAEIFNRFRMKYTTIPKVVSDIN